MSWKDLVCLYVIVLGVFLFLYGSNYYNAVFGWIGVSLIFGGLFAEIFLKVYDIVWKEGD